MSFKLRFHEDQTTGLVATCDVCGKVVTGDAANILWRPIGGEAPGKFHDYQIACKQPCTRVIDGQRGHQYSQDLDTALGYLVNNTKTNMARVKRNIEVLSLIG